MLPSSTAQAGDKLKMYNYMQQLDDIYKTGRIVTYTNSSELVEMIAGAVALKITVTLQVRFLSS